MTMNIYRNRLSYDFDSQGNTIDAMVGFNGMNDQGETTMATIKVTQDMLGEGKTFDNVSNKAGIIKLIFLIPINGFAV